MNVYYVGDPIVAHIELLKNGRPYPDLTGKTINVALLKKDMTIALDDRAADIDQPGDSNITATFTALETKDLVAGIYYLRARIEEGPETFLPDAVEIQAVA